MFMKRLTNNNGCKNNLYNVTATLEDWFRVTYT